MPRRDTPPQIVGRNLPEYDGDGKVAAPAADGRRTQRLRIDVDTGAIEVVDAYRTPKNRACRAAG
ncbi:hypothetical protein [Nonomuraea sp. NPDC050786]|uniref:hypothetical protein n=1 Tax=Nonomuraea sp. NPDC050786 TaxID=3154840 RepID=UPI00340B2C30